MSSKLVTLILGLVIGVGIGAVVFRQNSPAPAATTAAKVSVTTDDQVAELKSQLASAKAELTRAQADNDKLVARTQELLQREAANVAASDQPKKKPTGLAAMFGGDGTNGMSTAMRDMMKAAVEQQMEAKFAGMKAKLNLTPEQEKAIREIMGKETTRGVEMAQKMFSGELSQEEMEKMGDQPKSEEEQIKALLTPEQVTAYGEYEKEEQTRMARLVANSELMQMQSALRLTDEQQDKVFEVLVGQAQEQFDWKDTNPREGVDILRKKAEQKKAALQGVLTPEQFESYQKFQEQQMKMIEAFMPKSSTNENISNVHVTPMVGH